VAGRRRAGAGGRNQHRTAARVEPERDDSYLADGGVRSAVGRVESVLTERQACEWRRRSHATVALRVPVVGRVRGASTRRGPAGNQTVAHRTLDSAGLRGDTGLDWTGLDWTGLDWREVGIARGGVRMGFVTACKGSRGMGRRLRGGGRSTVSRHVGGAVLLSFIMLGAWSASARGYVWWESNNDGLVTSELDGSNLQRTACQDFAVKDARYLYFPGPASGALIGRESLDCSHVDNTFVLDTGAGGGTVYAVAVDSAHIYWSDANGIGRANIDGSNVTSGFVPASATGGTPQEIAVDAGHIYWSGVARGIGRANLDGSNPLANWLATAQYPGALATDGSHLYWSEPGGIGRVNTDGMGLTDPFVAYSGSDRTASITTDSHYLYWAQVGQIFGQGGTIGRANLDGSGINPTFIAPSVGVAGGIAVDSGTASASATSLACSPTVYESYIGDTATWALDAAGMCTVTVRDVGSAARSPGGSVVVSYAGEDPQATLPCLLKASDARASQCTVEEPLAGNGKFQAYFGAHKVLARYGGETFHLPSSAAPATTNVSKARAPAKVTASVGAPIITSSEVKINLQCPAAAHAPCVLALRVLRQTGHKTVTLGSVRVILAPGRRRTVRIGLNRAGRQLRRGKRHVRVRLVITQRNTAHRYITIIQRTITL
jgi:hypothetical protein